MTTKRTELLESLTGQLEGRIWTPDEAARAIALGARFVVVGSAITRPDVIARRFSDAVVRRAADPLTIGDRRWAGSTVSQ
jgi:hypothetical protein